MDGLGILIDGDGDEFQDPAGFLVIRWSQPDETIVEFVQDMVEGQMADLGKNDQAFISSQ